MSGLSLLYPAFLAGLAALSVPIILHLIFKFRRKPVVFPTLRFLRITTQKNARRLRLKELLLLALRLLIFALLALAFARPYFREGGGDAAAGKDETRTDLVLVLDDSYSMGRAVGKASLFEEAKELARGRLGALRSGDRVALVVTSEGRTPRVALTPNFGSVTEALRGVECSAAYAEYHPAVRTASRLLAASKAQRRVIALLGDMQRAAWESLAPLGRQGLPQGVRLEAERVGGGEPGNVAVVDVRVPRATFAVGRPVELVAKVAAYGVRRWPKLAASLVVNGRRADRRTLELDGALGRVKLSCELAKRQDIAGYVEIDCPDGLTLDNRFYFAQRLGEAVKVLCVEEDLDRPVYAQESYYLRKALRPAPEGREEEAPDTGFEPMVVSAANLDERLLGKADVVALVNVAGLNGAQLRALEERVREGTGLIVFLGDRVNPQFYNKRLLESGHGLLPAKLGTPWGEGAESSTSWRLGSVDAAHPVTRLFGPRGAASLASARFSRAYGLDVPDGARVLASFDDGRAALVEKAFGKGKVLLFASSADAAWGDFPKRKAYLLFVHQMVRYLSPGQLRGAARARVGESLRAPDEWAEAAWTLSGPDQRAVSVGAGEAHVATQPGLHEMRTGRERRPVAVNLVTRESDIEAASEAEVAKFLETLGSNPTKRGPLDDLPPRERAREAPLWRYLLALVLALMLVELAIANLAYRV